LDKNTEQTPQSNKNLAKPDRIIRSAIAVLMVYLFWTGHLKGYDGLAIRIVGVYMLITAFAGYCPLYSIFNFSTKRKEDKKTEK